MLQIIVSVHRRELGREVLYDFAFVPSGITLCRGCGRTGRDTLAPVETIHDDGGVETTGASLCKSCGLMFPLLPAPARATWPAVTARDVESLWDMVRKEQVAQALDAPASRPQGFDGALEAAR